MTSWDGKTASLWRGHARRALVAGLLGFASAAVAQTVSDVQFEAGNYGTMISGAITGGEYIDYRLAAQAGQDMFVQMMPGDSNGTGAVYFNVLPPGSSGEAIYNSSVAGETTTVALPSDGTYVIRVYLMGDDADSGKTTGFNIDLSIQ
jgi:hypothetical protein